MKILKALTLAIAILITTSCGSENSTKIKELEIKYVGKPVPFSQFSEIGSSETLSGTDGSRWVVYFDKGDFTFVTKKSTNTVTAVYEGRRSL